MTANGVRRGGRPPDAERQERRDGALQAALVEITEAGYEQVTMQSVARRASSSKESLYAWFGSKQGLVAELIRREAAVTNAVVERAVESPSPPREVLLGIAVGLLDLLTSETSLALNRAALSSPELAGILLHHGRHTTGPIIEGYLTRLRDDGCITADDPADSFRLLYGLVVQDSQIRALLGESRPSSEERQRQAGTAVDRYLALTRRRPSAP